jgi:hypothetical protein
MLPAHFVSRPIDGGYSWTLPSRLGDMLGRAEEQFGPRDKEYTVLGIEFGPDPSPHLWFPGNAKRIVIQLASNALLSDYVAQYQLAHECIHLLAPSGMQGATVMEEGLAVVFAEDYVRPLNPCNSPTTEAKYVASAALVRPLLSIRRDFIRQLREIEPSFRLMKADQVRHVVPEASADAIRRLLLPYYEVSAFDIAGQL